ncbi:hypothetical protein ACFRCW_28805 [Streptomyces sp. NPDC056653]
MKGSMLVAGAGPTGPFGSNDSNAEGDFDALDQVHAQTGEGCTD